jgi:hypothetical protein
MKTSDTVLVVFVVILFATVGLLFEAWLLGLILSWFGVTLSFWQNFAIIALANLIIKPTGVSSK